MIPEDSTLVMVLKDPAGGPEVGGDERIEVLGIASELFENYVVAAGLLRIVSSSKYRPSPLLRRLLRSRMLRPEFSSFRPTRQPLTALARDVGLVAVREGDALLPFTIIILNRIIPGRRPDV